MKKLIMIVVLLAITFACKTNKEDKKNEEKQVVTATYDSFGDKITETDYISSADAYTKYQTLKAGDTINLKFASTINEVCSKKGCWMKLPAGETEETIMVRFKDYGFFMPLDSKGRNVIVEGKAFVKEVSVDELKHYAEDAGKSKEEIAKITEPKLELAFEANGVLMKK
ncbi:DUF4920 domain-containing protein [Pseudotenacibaculum sp. MALMAid0570]|uniref:DUF4920 domain-containing protein n=1 Tax=Pseudotenacibaculum sp. MALMAid0570 TaxID=3143938 RepID=UPI0032DE8864